MQSVEEENPALGWRAIRIGLDRPALLRMQIRALLKGAGGRALKIMFPMVATCDEFVRAKVLVEREKTHLSRHGYPLPADLKLGAMLEVPSLLFQLKEICAARRFPLDRLQRPDAVSVRHRPREPPGRRPFRPA